MAGAGLATAPDVQLPERADEDCPVLGMVWSFTDGGVATRVAGHRHMATAVHGMAPFGHHAASPPHVWSPRPELLAPAFIDLAAQARQLLAEPDRGGLVRAYPMFRRAHPRVVDHVPRDRPPPAPPDLR
ncbi:hypothetical protein GCM10023321_63970 [Pseudonocardia eucalypti]|uniref:Uncharacterized protein n=1 Tax=Pseudonocardia eucalypti TaxID=648755 RepID=A0ABP9QY89_9PSEU